MVSGASKARCPVDSLNEGLREHTVSATEAKVPKQEPLKLLECTEPPGQWDSKNLVYTRKSQGTLGAVWVKGNYSLKLKGQVSHLTLTDI